MILEHVEIEGSRLEVARWGASGGKKLPILLLHEGLGSIALWKGFPEALAAATGRAVIAWSRRGHGWSSPEEGRRSPDYMHLEAALLPALHEALGLKRAHWLGHSDGGSIALIGASKYPDRAASLLLEAPHVFVEELTVSSIATVTAAFGASDMGERMKRYHCDPATLFSTWSEIWLSPEFRSWNIESYLAHVAAPTLLIQGRDDQYGTMAQLERIEAVLPDTMRVEFDNCGHSPHSEREAAVIEAIRAFLIGRE